MKKMRVLIKGANADLNYLIEQIELARSLSWKETNEIAYYHHCMICGYTFNPNDTSQKYHAGSSSSRAWLDPDCYQRFIVADGIPDLLDKAFEVDEESTM
ncbi:MAG: hypothetical protein AB1644_10580 [Candidatus Zixiibacteriota bacterium]